MTPSPSFPPVGPQAGNLVQGPLLRDVLAMYPNLREAQVRYLEKWGLIRPTKKDGGDVYSFADVAVLRQVSAGMLGGVTFHAAVRAIAAERAGQMALDFRGEPDPPRVVTWRPRESASEEQSDTVVDRRAAEEHFSQASELDDGHPARREAAAQAYRQALEADPYLIPALINLGNLHYAKDELVEAQALYERVLVLSPEVFEAYYNLGNVHHDRGRFEMARECYGEAVRLNPGHADGHFYLAVTLEKMGRSAEAKPHWRTYQQLAPDGEWVELAREFSE